ncbi:hypothetical protein WME89_07945 [Sorangium sp. So ce321]|uniref:hypothetical protein n=1 Tax=Sorangium sp. So ce321 TaxID=3133300 RepID=UPI003F5FE6D5
MSKTDLDGRVALSVVDQGLLEEATRLYGRLSVERYCEYATALLNGPKIEDRLAPAAGIRALSNSLLLYTTEAEGVISAMLYYLVTLCEGLIMPHVQPLIALAIDSGHKGPRAANGRYDDAERAQKNFGPAIKFLATHAQSALTHDAPRLAQVFRDYDLDGLSKLRNSIAHFKFRFEIVRVRLDKVPELAANPLLHHMGQKALELMARLLKLPVSLDGTYADASKSLIRYEEKLDRPLTQSSRARTFQDVRRLVPDLEKLAFSLAFAYIETGTAFQKRGVIKLGECGHCKEGMVAAPATVLTVPCPACGELGNLH